MPRTSQCRAVGWFTAADLDKFKAKIRALIMQYSAYEPVPGYPVNGELTLGENIADNSGLAVAYKAYKRSLGAKEAPVIDRLTGEQRFFMSFAQVFRGKTRASEAIMRIKLDPHAPEEVRGTVPERNLAPFYETFGVKSADKMYLPPERRVTIW